jgi:hypothetical protein
MPLLVFMKACHPFNSHVIRFCGPGCKNDVLWIGTNQVGNVLEQSMRLCKGQAGGGEPSLHPPLPYPLPSHMRVFDYVGSHTDPSSRGAWHPARADLLE